MTCDFANRRRCSDVTDRNRQGSLLEDVCGSEESAQAVLQRESAHLHYLLHYLHPNIVDFMGVCHTRNPFGS